MKYDLTGSVHIKGRTFLCVLEVKEMCYGGNKYNDSNQSTITINWILIEEAYYKSRQCFPEGNCYAIATEANSPTTYMGAHKIVERLLHERPTKREKYQG